MCTSHKVSVLLVQGPHFENHCIEVHTEFRHFSIARVVIVKYMLLQGEKACCLRSPLGISTYIWIYMECICGYIMEFVLCSFTLAF